MTNYSATLAPPTGWVSGQRLIGVTGSGDVAPDGSGYYRVSTQRAVGWLVGKGFTIVSITPASVDGNQGW